MTKMRIGLALAAAMLSLLASPATPRTPPLRNPAMLNIGFICHWQARCMERQGKAMRKSLDFVDNRRPPAWKVQMCNRNASRAQARGDWRRGRVDWIGFNNCIRNKRLNPPRARARRS